MKTHLWATAVDGSPMSMLDATLAIEGSTILNFTGVISAVKVLCEGGKEDK